MAAVEEKENYARSVRDVDATALDALGAWAVTKAPRDAARAAEWAEEAKAIGEALSTDARTASVAALAHSENDDVRALCGTDAVKTITSLAGFVKDQRRDVRSTHGLQPPSLASSADR